VKKAAEICALDAGQGFLFAAAAADGILIIAKSRAELERALT